MTGVQTCALPISSEKTLKVPSVSATADAVVILGSEGKNINTAPSAGFPFTVTVPPTGTLFGDESQPQNANRVINRKTHGNFIVGISAAELEKASFPCGVEYWLRVLGKCAGQVTIGQWLRFLLHPE